MIRDFCQSGSDLTKSGRGFSNLMSDNALRDLKLLSEHPSWFSKDGKDLRAYYAFLDAYHAINDYCEYRAKYNMKDVELEDAIKNWYAVIQKKPNIFSKIIQRIK